MGMINDYDRSLDSPVLCDGSPADHARIGCTCPDLEPVTFTRGGDTFTRAYGTLREAVQAMRPYTCNTARARMSAELTAWFRVVAPGGRVTAWRTGPDEAIIETTQPVISLDD
jgi:hypothetical protein